MDINPYQQTADRIASYYTGTVAIEKRDQIHELEALAQNIDTFIKIEPSHPGLHFLKGLNNSLLSGRYKSNNDETSYQKSINDKMTEYQKAMELDLANEPHLSAAMYATMKHGLEGDLKIQAIQSELKLGGNGESESYYWYLHWSNINTLKQAGRLQEAEKALQSMKQELYEKRPEDTLYQTMVEHIDHELKQPAQISKQISQQTTETKNLQKPKAPDRKEVIIWVIVIISALAIFLLMLYEFVLRKK
ncbi:MAG TPA: hypothetical protein VIQ03_15590 [Gammaproteobacteria bacterium]